MFSYDTGDSSLLPVAVGRMGEFENLFHVYDQFYFYLGYRWCIFYFRLISILEGHLFGFFNFAAQLVPYKGRGRFYFVIGTMDYYIVVDFKSFTFSCLIEGRFCYSPPAVFSPVAPSRYQWVLYDDIWCIQL